MSSEADIFYEAKGSIATITLNRVNRHNALTLQMLNDIERAVADVERAGAPALGVPTDVRSADQVAALAAVTLEQFGRVDLVVNNAGVSAMPGPMWSYEVNDWEWVLSVNLWGVVHGVRAFVPHLVAQNSGHVVNTASMAGVSAGPCLGAYTTSKHAVVGLSESLAADLAIAAPGVGVTVVCPGQMLTNIVTADRNRPESLAAVDRGFTEAELRAVTEWMATVSGPEITADAAAAAVIDGIENNRLHVAPNGSITGVRTRVERLLDDLAAGLAT